MKIKWKMTNNAYRIKIVRQIIKKIVHLTLFLPVAGNSHAIVINENRFTFAL